MNEELMALYAKMKDLYPGARITNLVFEVPTNKPLNEVFIKWNRDLDKNHVQRLKKDIAERGQKIPGNMRYDGKLTECQHRYAACQELGIPLKVILSDDTRKDITAINQLNKNWNMENWMQSYIDEDPIRYHNYVKFKEFLNKTGHEINVALGLVLNNETMGKIYPNRNNIQKIFKDGELDVDTEGWERAEQYAKKINDFKKYNKDIYKKKTFVLAYQKALNTDGFSHTRMIKKVADAPYELRPCTTSVNYLELLQGIYNKDLPKLNRIWLI